MGRNVSGHQRYPNQPVEQITWAEAVDFCSRLTASERVVGRIPENHEYRLPTEAEWEYAARAGSSTRFSFGEDPGYVELPNHAWFFVDGEPHGVGAKLPNAWGVYDLYGNVAEWCLDWYGQYSGGTARNPLGPVDGEYRVIRGGCYSDEGVFLRSSCRLFEDPTKRFVNVGFRVVLAPVRSRQA